MKNQPNGAAPIPEFPDPSQQQQTEMQQNIESNVRSLIGDLHVSLIASNAKTAELQKENARLANQLQATAAAQRQQYEEREVPGEIRKV
jgi:hypothetical protein